jgi:hypothetical protein
MINVICPFCILDPSVAAVRFSGRNCMKGIILAPKRDCTTRHSRAHLGMPPGREDQVPGEIVFEPGCLSADRAQAS